MQKAHYEAGILYNPGNHVKGDWNDPQEGYRCMSQLKEQKVSAVFCMNDVIAAGVYKYALENGIQIPQALSVVGFDNQVIASVLCPGLTTVALPLDRIGVEAVARMEELIAGREASGVATLRCEAVYRESVFRL
jgi:LacI family transcriptional regulator